MNNEVEAVEYSAMNNEVNENDRLCNFGFVSLNIMVLFSFCNLAVFFSFYNYLKTLPIPLEWNGVLIGLLSASALVVRPFISTKLTPGNAIKGIAAGLFLTIASLLLYPLAHSLAAMILLRLFHGCAYVTLVSSSVALLVVFMPLSRSGQGFGIITISTLLPYAVIPYVVEAFFADVPQDYIYSATALLMLPAAILLIPLNKHIRRRKGDKSSWSNTKLPHGSLLINLKNPRILSLLGCNCLLFSVYSLIFFFLKTFCANLNVGNPGLFFTIATSAMIAVRLCFGHLFDRYNKAVLIIISLIFFGAGILLISFIDSRMMFYIAAVIYGVGFGAATPLLNGLVYTASAPEYRGLNTNLMLEMVDAGFFIGPALSGLALSFQVSGNIIIYSCLIAIILAVIIISPLVKTQAKGVK